MAQEYGYNFTINMLESASVMQDSAIGWNEIHDQTLRYKTSSSILSFIDNLGGLYLSEVPCSDKIEFFATKNVQMIVRTSVTVDSTTCFSPNGNEGNSICFPHSSLQSSQLNCTTFVSSFYSLDNQRSNMFPDYISNEDQATPDESSYLGSDLIGLTVNNASLSLAGSLVRLEFHHSGGSGSGSGGWCVWWDVMERRWSTSGCQASQAESSDRLTVCHCDHLTNFGVMFDYQGKAEPNDPVLSVVSTVLLSLSSLSLLLTQTLLALTR